MHLKQVLFTKTGLIVAVFLSVILFVALLLGVVGPRESFVREPVGRDGQKITLPEQIDKPQFKSVTTGSVGLGLISVTGILGGGGVSLPLYLGGEIDLANLAKSFGFDGEMNFFAGEGLRGWSKDEGKESLIIDTRTGEAVYTVGVLSTNASPSASLASITEPTQVVEVSNAFLKERGFNTSNLVALTAPLDYMITSGGELEETDKFEVSDYAVVKYKFVLDGYPIFDGVGKERVWVFWVDRSARVVRFEFSTNAYLQDSRQRGVENALSVVERLRGGVGVIVSAGDKFSAGDFARTDVESVELGYFQNPDKIIQPIYRVGASGFYKGSSTPVNFIIYLPALR